MAPKEIYYSDKYNDDKFEYRHVMLPKDIAKLVPKTHLVSNPIILSAIHWGLGIRIVRIPRPPLVIRYPRGLGIRTQKNTDSISEQILSELFDPRGSISELKRMLIRYLNKFYPNYLIFGSVWQPLFGYQDPWDQKVIKNRKLICTGFWRSEYGELKNLCRTSLARLGADIKAFFSSWQVFDPRGLNIRTGVSVSELI